MAFLLDFLDDPEEEEEDDEEDELDEELEDESESESEPLDFFFFDFLLFFCFFFCFFSFLRCFFLASFAFFFKWSLPAESHARIAAQTRSASFDGSSSGPQIFMTTFASLVVQRGAPALFLIVFTFFLVRIS